MAEREDGYGLNVALWKKDHPGHVLIAGPQGDGYTARRKDSRGRGLGKPVTRLTLDELAAAVEPGRHAAAS
jgi:hypothetical protein